MINIRARYGTNAFSNTSICRCIETEAGNPCRHCWTCFVSWKKLDPVTIAFLGLSYRDTRATSRRCRREFILIEDTQSPFAGLNYRREYLLVPREVVEQRTIWPTTAIPHGELNVLTIQQSQRAPIPINQPEARCTDNLLRPRCHSCPARAP